MARRGNANHVVGRIAAAALAACAVVRVWMPGIAQAQELAPRAYWPAPVGTDVLSTTYQYSTGDIVTDPSLPLAGVDSRIHVAQAAYQRTFGLFGRTGSLQLSLPYSWATTEGSFRGQSANRDVDGWADARLRFAINLLGAPAMDREAFGALLANPVTQVGFSVLVQAPSGQYDADRLVNIGTNRWAVKPAIGLIHPVARGWMLEFELGGWFLGDNDDFIGQTREQDPILSTEMHLVRHFPRGVWASLDANFYTGGRTKVGAEERADLQRNSRFGATVTWPFLRRHALRGSYSTGLVTESGGDYDMYSISYLYAW